MDTTYSSSPSVTQRNPYISQDDADEEEEA